MLEFYYLNAKNLISSHVLMLYIILTLQIINLSPLFSESHNNIAERLLDLFMTLLIDQKIVKVYIETNYFDSSQCAEERGVVDQTTRMQILYEYYNGDQYNLRLDLAHKGVDFFHINNLSKGGVDIFPLDSVTYNKIIELRAEHKLLFFKYKNSNLYVLRDKYKLEIEKPEFNSVKEILDPNRHFKFIQEYDEKEVLCFFEQWFYFLSQKVDKLPKEKILPKYFYIEQSFYNFVIYYYFSKRTNEAFDEESFKENLIRFLINGEIVTEETAINDLSNLDVTDIFYYALIGILEKIK